MLEAYELTPTEAADGLGIAPQTVRRWLCSEVTPSTASLALVADFFEVSWDALLSEAPPSMLAQELADGARHQRVLGRVRKQDTIDVESRFRPARARRTRRSRTFTDLGDGTERPTDTT